MPNVYVPNSLEIQLCNIIQFMKKLTLPIRKLITSIHTCAGFVGMAFSYGLSLNNTLVNCIQRQCSLANQIISVERVNHYMDIQSEPEVIEENRPAPDWPQVGSVELRDLKVIKFKHVHVHLTR